MNSEKRYRRARAHAGRRVRAGDDREHTVVVHALLRGWQRRVGQIFQGLLRAPRRVDQKNEYSKGKGGRRERERERRAEEDVRGSERGLSCSRRAVVPAAQWFRSPMRMPVAGGVVPM